MTKGISDGKTSCKKAKESISERFQGQGCSRHVAEKLSYVDCGVSTASNQEWRRIRPRRRDHSPTGTARGETRFRRAGISRSPRSGRRTIRSPARAALWPGRLADAGAARAGETGGDERQRFG